MDVLTTIDEPAPDPAAIADRVRRSAGVLIDEVEAARVARALTHADLGHLVAVAGRDIVTGLPSRCSLSPQELLGP